MNEPTTPEKDELKIQEPGAMPPALSDEAKLEALAEGTVGDLAESLDQLTDVELERLTAIETLGKGRTTALGAIAREQERREIDRNGGNAAEPAAPNIGDSQSYAHLRASQVDTSKLTSRVLTLDGWLLPKPQATPQE